MEQQEVPRVPLGTKPARMWKNFISQRRPVVISGIDEQWAGFTDDLMLERAGDVPVMVEVRSSAREGFGRGRKVAMPLRQLVEAVRRGDSGLYMSTQEVGVGRDGHPLLYGPPLIQLAGAFPLEQPLMGQLVPQSINVWMGCAPEGASSGLHHDFHDNLYVLLRGVKRFRLFPPSAARGMYMHGSIAAIHPNGRIVYEGQGDINADGSDARDVKLWQARQRADAAAAAAAAQGGGGADDALEAQLEALLQEGCGGVDDEGHDDYIASDDDDASGSDSGAGRRSGKASKQRKKKRRQQQQQQQQRRAAAAAGSSGDVEPPPPSFSRVDCSRPAAELAAAFPRFPGVGAAAEVVLRAGEMLYLPAGWLHEVTSYGGPGLDGGHLAVNYWFHPPDRLDPGKAGFQQPYSSAFFPSLWAGRRAWLQDDAERWWAAKQQQQHHKPPPQPQQQQVAPPALRPGSGLKRRVVWDDSAASPPNRYRMAMTRSGTASGSVDSLPGGQEPAGSGPHAVMLSDDDTDDDTQSPSTSGGADATPGEAAAAAGAGSKRRRRGGAAAAPAGDDAGLAADVDDGDGDDGLGGVMGADGEAMLSSEVGEGIAALESYFQGDDAKEAMKRMLAEWLSERAQRLAAVGGDDGRGEETLPLPRLWGRRHHYTVAVSLTRRPRAPR